MFAVINAACSCMSASSCCVCAMRFPLTLHCYDVGPLFQQGPFYKLVHWFGGKLFNQLVPTQLFGRCFALLELVAWGALHQQFGSSFVVPEQLCCQRCTCNLLLAHTCWFVKLGLATLNIFTARCCSFSIINLINFAQSIERLYNRSQWHLKFTTLGITEELDDQTARFLDVNQTILPEVTHAGFHIGEISI